MDFFQRGTQNRFIYYDKYPPSQSTYPNPSASKSPLGSKHPEYLIHPTLPPNRRTRHFKHTSRCINSSKCFWWTAPISDPVELWKRGGWMVHETGGRLGTGGWIWVYHAWVRADTTEGIRLIPLESVPLKRTLQITGVYAIHGLYPYWKAVGFFGKV